MRRPRRDQRDWRQSFFEETRGADLPCVSFWSPKGMGGDCFPFLTFTKGGGFREPLAEKIGEGNYHLISSHPCLQAPGFCDYLGPWEEGGSYWENSRGNWSLWVAEAGPLYQSLDGMQLEAVGTWGQKGQKGLLLPVSWTSRVWWGRHLSFPEA